MKQGHLQQAAQDLYILFRVAVTHLLDVPMQKVLLDRELLNCCLKWEQRPMLHGVPPGTE